MKILKSYLPLKQNLIYHWLQITRSCQFSKRADIGRLLDVEYKNIMDEMAFSRCVVENVISHQETISNEKAFYSSSLDKPCSVYTTKKL